MSTLTPGQDVIWPGRHMKGHTGSAYGLESNYFFDPETRDGYVFAMNGALYGYNRSNTSSFDAVVQSLQMITYDYLYAKEADEAKPVTE